ncbi:MAG: alkene reductase [Alphaproteobacteria bacterium]|nr:alkene reductase [Alphaproteobacteria bacterium]
MSDSDRLLFQPTQLGAFTLKNRVVMAPMTRSRADAEGVLPDMAATYYRQRAAAGLIITEGTQPSFQGQGYCRTPGLHTDAQVAAWAKVADAVHADGGRIFVQLMHVGRIGHVDNQHGSPGLVAPSAIPAAGMMYTDTAGMQPHSTPAEMSAEDIAGVIEDFRGAARRANQAGLDGVELHAANGYLGMQFLSTSTNQRTDAYGGSAENRCRFVVEVLEAMIAELGPGRVGVRISPGGTFNDISDDDPMLTYSTLLDRLAGLPLAYIHAQRTGWPHLGVLKAKMKVPFIVAGGFDAASGEAALQAGEAELIGFGRPYLANPDLVARMRAGAPLNEPDPGTFYTPGPKGYIDYPTL